METIIMYQSLETVFMVIGIAAVLSILVGYVLILISDLFDLFLWLFFVLVLLHLINII